jgi:hypothetical protein
LSQSNEVRTQATERLFLAVVNQAISDVLENGKQAKEAERWLLSKDFDALDRLFVQSQWNRHCKEGIGKTPKV